MWYANCQHLTQNHTIFHPNQHTDRICILEHATYHTGVISMITGSLRALTIPCIENRTESTDCCHVCFRAVMLFEMSTRRQFLACEALTENCMGVYCMSGSCSTRLRSHSHQIRPSDFRLSCTRARVHGPLPSCLTAQSARQMYCRRS